VQHDMAKIFVGGLSWQSSEETLRYHFEQYGEVVSVEVMRDRNTGDPRGFAFVVFKEDATVELVMANIPHEINHKTVDVKRAQARGMAPPSIHNNIPGQAQNSVIEKEEVDGGDFPPGGTREMTPEQLQNKIFVGGLPIHLNKEGLNDYFSQFGAVVDAIVMMDMSQSRSRGFGFVTFENGSGGAQKALKAQPIYIENKYVEIKLATPKGDSQNATANGGSKRYQNQSNTGGLRNANAADASSQPKGEFSGLAASYGRNGWRAGYGTVAFGSTGWAVKGWEDGSSVPEKVGFSFAMLDQADRKSQTVASICHKSTRHRTGSESSRDIKRPRY